jgi:hypothetical protein
VTQLRYELQETQARSADDAFGITTSSPYNLLCVWT